MTNYQKYIPQLRQMLLSGSEDNITLAIEIAESMNLVDEIMYPFRKFWKIYSETRKSDRFIMSKLGNMHYLKLEGKKLKTIPEAVFMLPKLNYLLLGNNELETIPAEIANLSNLADLDLRNNRFTNFPKQIFALKNLKKLVLLGNEIDVLPNEISELKKLEHLHLAYNYIETLPNSLTHISNLCTLNVNDNEIINFPAEIAQMPSLHAIFVENNKLNNFPKVSVNLRDLNISRNKFVKTPDVLLNKNNLNKLDISFNPGFVWNLNKVKISKLNHFAFEKTVVNRFNAISNLKLIKFYGERNLLVKVFSKCKWPEHFVHFLSGMKVSIFVYDEYADCEDGWWIGHPDEDYYKQVEDYYGFRKEDLIAERFVRNERLKCVRA